MRRFYLSKSFKPLVKGWAIWEEQENKSWPVLYIRKPKNTTDKEFDELVRLLMPGWPLPPETDLKNQERQRLDDDPE